MHKQLPIDPAWCRGIYVNGKRPKDEKAVRRAVRREPTWRGMTEALSRHPPYMDPNEPLSCRGVWLEPLTPVLRTGDDYGGPLTHAPNGDYYFVGPDPVTDRKFFGCIAIRYHRFRVTW
jgi:hypothetical protein